MQVGDAITELRNKTNDRDEVGLDDSELLSYLNEAVQYVCAYLIGGNSPLFLHNMTISTVTATLPHNFVRTAGNFPIKITGNIIELLDDPPLNLRYFTSNNILLIDDDMPFTQDALNQISIKLATIYVNNQEQLDVSQDSNLLQSINTAIVAAISGQQ